MDASILVVTNSKNYGKKNEKKSRVELDKIDNDSEKPTEILENRYNQPKSAFSKLSGYRSGYNNNENFENRRQSSYENRESYGKNRQNREYENNNNNGYDNNDDYKEIHAVAHRLRCSVIATRNDSDCTTCCQLAARLDRSISKVKKKKINKN